MFMFQRQLLLQLMLLLGYGNTAAGSDRLVRNILPARERARARHPRSRLPQMKRFAAAHVANCGVPPASQISMLT
jgi:hypothetical protein